MNGASTIADSLVREHILLRGLPNALKAFDQDLKAGKDLKLQVDKFVADTLAAIDNLDIDMLKSTWDLWKAKVFNSLSGCVSKEWEAQEPDVCLITVSYRCPNLSQVPLHRTAAPLRAHLSCNLYSAVTIHKKDVKENARLTTVYETDMYRLYLVKCMENKRLDKCNQFFLKCAALTQNNPIWAEWFAFPYHPKPESCQAYRKYYSNEWREIFMISLHNFVRIAIQSAPKPHLVQMIELLSEADSSSDRTHSVNCGLMTNPFEDELMDDFAVIAQCSGTLKMSTSKPSLKAFFKNLTSGTRKSYSES